MVPNHETIRQRLHLLESYVRQLHSYRQRTLAEVLDDIGLAWAIERGLQLSIQCIIDVCHYLVAVLALGTPATSQEAVELLRDAGVFPAAFARTLVQMVRFRNILVYVYAQVDVRRVYDNLQNHLDDFGQFAQHVLHFLVQQTEAQGDVAPIHSWWATTLRRTVQRLPLGAFPASRRFGAAAALHWAARHRSGERG